MLEQEILSKQGLEDALMQDPLSCIRNMGWCLPNLAATRRFSYIELLTRSCVIAHSGRQPYALSSSIIAMSSLDSQVTPGFSKGAQYDKHRATYAAQAVDILLENP